MKRAYSDPSVLAMLATALTRTSTAPAVQTLIPHRFNSVNNNRPIPTRSATRTSSPSWRSDDIPGPNNRLTGQTPLSATLGADYKRGQLTTGGSFVFKNGGEVRISSNQVSYESVRRDLDLYALWKFDPRYQLRLAASNLLGQDYIVAASYTQAGSGMQRSRTIYPGSPALEMKF